MTPIALPVEQPVLLTPRLRLRPFVADDALQVQCLAGDDAVAETTLVIPHPYLDGVAQAWIAVHAQQWADAKCVTWAITDRDHGELLGSMELSFRLGRHQAAAGYWVGREHWGRGLATEALRAAVDWGFDTLGLQRIEASHLTRNPASGRVMAKVGMRQEGTLRASALCRGQLEDMALWAMLAGDPRPALGGPTTTR